MRSGVILTTGQNGPDGLDVVVEGRAVEVSDAAELEQVANTYELKYGAHFTAPEGTWFGLSDAIRAGKVLLYRVTPTTMLGFARGEQFSQTRGSLRSPAPSTPCTSCCTPPAPAPSQRTRRGNQRPGEDPRRRDPRWLAARRHRRRGPSTSQHRDLAYRRHQRSRMGTTSPPPRTTNHRRTTTALTSRHAHRRRDDDSQLTPVPIRRCDDSCRSGAHPRQRVRNEKLGASIASG